MSKKEIIFQYLAKEGNSEKSVRIAIKEIADDYNVTVSVGMFQKTKREWSEHPTYVDLEADIEEFTDIFENEQRCYSVYIHLFPNNAIYIGQTKYNPSERWANGSGYKDANKLLNININRYGWDNIHHLIYKDKLTKEEADIIEKDLIKFYSDNEVVTGRVVLNIVHNNG